MTLSISSNADILADTLAEGATLAADARISEAAVAATLASDSGAARRSTGTGSRISTVLPRVEPGAGTVRLVDEARDRYKTERTLGEGGMGIVDLARDQDIERRVAIKRIRPGAAGELGVARFVEEIRTIGSLEHPNIVPVHDVGLDEEGRYFIVMKYVEGETVEQIIEKLAAGDPEAHKRYTFEARAEIFMGLLRALAYAHDRGIIHRDIKPANVMVGPYGEVVLMDWGIARPIRGADLPPIPENDEPDESAPRRRLVQTASSALIGTPMYMSPEQARGQADLDERSDLYSACALFQELLTLEHYLADRTNVTGVLAGVMTSEIPPGHELSFWAKSAHQTPVPAEYTHFLRRGMAKDRDARWQSASDMIVELENMQAGKIRVQCPCTLSKRATREAGRWVDRHPLLTMVGLGAGALSIVAGIAGGIMAIATLL